MKISPNEKFAIWRRRKKMSQDDVAKQFSISQGYVSHMEQGIRPVPARILKAMPKKMTLGDGDILFTRMRRQGLNMDMAVVLFRCTHTRLLTYIRNQRPVPKGMWDKIDEDERRFTEYKEKKAGNIL
jgi:transcriptional regulator with XRE-family HTH domain